MKVPLGSWAPEPGESDDEFNERVYREMMAAIALMRGRAGVADSEAATGVAPEAGGVA